MGWASPTGSDSGSNRMSLNLGATSPPARSRYTGWIVAAVLALLVVAFAGSPAGRRLIGSLREQPVHSVNVSLAGFDNQTVQQMIAQMVAQNVTTVESGRPQPAASAAQASQLAGFKARLLGARNGAPRLSVSGEQAVRMRVDRARLELILREAGRRNLAVPASVNGALITVRIPRMIHARYGTCPKRASAAANLATPAPSSTRYSSCLFLVEGPGARIDTPASFDFAPLVQIGLEAAGMTPAQARQFLRRVNWQSLLGMPIPPSLRSYSSVDVHGVEGTLFDMSVPGGPSYALIWSEGGLNYSLVGFGDSLGAVKLADSLG